MLGAWLAFGAACAGWTQGVAAPAFRPRPAWKVPDAPCRLVVSRERDAFFLVQVPQSLEGRPVSAVRAFASSNECPVRVVWTDACLATVLIDAQAAAPAQAVRVYPVPGAAAVAVSPAAWTDPAPLRGVSRRTAGMDFPSSLEDVKTLEARCDTAAQTFVVEDFSQLGATFKNWYRGDWTRKNHLVDLQTWLLVPADGALLFGLAGVAPAWLLVDGAPVLAHPAHQAYDVWTTGREVPLRAGLRRVQIRTVCREQIDTGLAWKRPGEPGVAKDVVMVTGGDLKTGRWEWRDRRLHPYATASSRTPYRFAGVGEVFFPFVLEDESACWGTNCAVRWQSGGQWVGSGTSAALTLRASAMPARVTACLEAASGETAQHELMLSGNGPAVAEYDVTTRVTGLPAVCYGDDRVQPIIRVRTSAPDGLVYELESEIQRVSGEVSRRTDTFATDKGWARVHLSQVEAGSVSNVVWTLRHAGAGIARGRAEFWREPFERLPDAVSGEMLKAGESFVVVVASKASRGDVAAEKAAEAGPVALLDGFLFTGEEARLMGGSAGAGLPASWRVADLSACEQSEAASGMSLLLPFASVRELLPAAAVVYAPSLLAVGRESGTDGCERRVAALAGLLSGPACGRPRLLLVVPPAFDVLPGCGCEPGGSPCAHAAAARAYAEIVVRVADAHGAETVDLFTAFSTAGARPPLVRNGTLTPEGCRLAARLILKKLGLSTEKTTTQTDEDLVGFGP